MKKKPIKTKGETSKKEIPEGCISSEEFYRIFKEKLIAAYENL